MLKLLFKIKKTNRGRNQKTGKRVAFKQKEKSRRGRNGKGEATREKRRGRSGSKVQRRY